MSRIVVIGSINTDMVVRTASIPVPGQTVMGHSFATTGGGKGANQAVAAARLGATVSLVGRLGMDSFGEEAKAALEKEMINTAHVAMDPASASGIALIVIDDAGENSIVVAPGSNGRLEAEDIYRAEDIVLSADMVLFQLEVPVDTVIAGIRFAVECGRKVMLNPAPAAPLPAELFPLVHIITPNQSEAFALTGVTVLDIQTAQAACDILHQRGVKSVVITMAEQGAYLSTNEERLMVPGFKAGEVVDTVAAGDTFCGALAVALAEGKTWKPALQFANAAAALSVTRRGAQASIPHREEVEWLLRSI